MVIEQLFWGPSSKGPTEAPQVLLCAAPQESVSAKLGRPLKSLQPPKGLLAPARESKDSVSPARVAPEGSVLVRTIVCVVGADPSAWGGKVSEAGDNEIGSVQPVALPNAIQTFPASGGMKSGELGGLEQTFVVTP